MPDPEEQYVELGCTVERNTDEEIRKARLCVASQATDPEDCAELLMTLGLMEPDFHWERSEVSNGLQNRRKVARHAQA